MNAAFPHFLWKDDAAGSGNFRNCLATVQVNAVFQVSHICKLATVEGIFSRRVQEIDIVRLADLRQAKRCNVLPYGFLLIQGQTSSCKRIGNSVELIDQQTLV